MDKKIPNKDQEIKNISLEQRRKRNSSGSAQINDKRLPWWVELLFVQIGLPDKWLINLLKTKKSAKELYKTKKKILLWGAFFTFSLIYTYPLIKYVRSKNYCEKNAIDYLVNSKRGRNINKAKVSMLAINFCNGGEEIFNTKD